MSLSPKQKRFCEEYCANGFNATKAAISAGYSEKSVATNTTKLLNNTKVKEYVEEYKQSLTVSASITVEGILERLAIESGYAGEHRIPDDSTQSARMSALKMLSEYTGGFDNNVDKVEIDGLADIAARLQNARNRK